MSKYLNAESILAAEDFMFAEVDVPEWGGKVRVRSLSGSQRTMIKKAVENKDTDDLEELITVMSVVDDDGKRILQRKQIPQLKEKSTAPISRIAQKVMEISGISNPEMAIEEAKKNFNDMNEDSAID